MDFTEITAKQLTENIVGLFDDRWTLITAGDKDGYNTMAASWGGMGKLWDSDVCFIFVRQSRYTKEFIDNCDYFTVSALPQQYKKAVAFCGRASGRDCDKFAQSGITPLFTDGTVAVGEADTIFVCKKLSATVLAKDSFIDDSVNECYPTDDYHTMYIGKIIKILKK